MRLLNTRHDRPNAQECHVGNAEGRCPTPYSNSITIYEGAAGESQSGNHNAVAKAEFTAGGALGGIVTCALTEWQGCFMYGGGGVWLAQANAPPDILPALQGGEGVIEERRAQAAGKPPTPSQAAVARASWLRHRIASCSQFPPVSCPLRSHCSAPRPHVLAHRVANHMGGEGAARNGCESPDGNR